MGISKCKINTPISNKHPRQKHCPNHQSHPSHRPPHSPRILLRFGPIYNPMGIQAVHNFLRLGRRRHITDRRTRIGILIYPHPIRAAGLQNSFHIPVRGFRLVQRHLIIIFDIGGDGGHRVAQVVALGRLCESCDVGVAHYGGCHGVFPCRVIRCECFRDATRNSILAVIYGGDVQCC